MKRLNILILFGSGLVVLSAGCNAIVGTKPDSITGTWTGILQSQTYYSRAGTQFKGCVIQIESGPELVGKLYGPYTQGNGLMATLAVRNGPNSAARIAKCSPDLIGKRVAVTGKRINLHVYNREEDSPSTDEVLVPERGLDVVEYVTHTIILEGPVRAAP